jgi:hypothetical protein
MAAASCAHISAYSASLTAIAGVFCPKKLVATSTASWMRFAATTGGGTVAAKAVSKAAAAARAWPAVRSACVAVAAAQATYGAIAAAMVNDAPPDHRPCSPESVVEYPPA